MTSDQLKKKKESYAKNPKIKEKQRFLYQKNKEKIKEERKKSKTHLLSLITKENNEEISKMKTIQNILHNFFASIENLERVFEKPNVLCDCCKRSFMPSAILTHIRQSSDCKSHYGPTYEKIKNIKDMINEKNKLAKKNENYDTNPEIRVKAKESSKKAYQKLKAKRLLKRKK